MRNLVPYVVSQLAAESSLRPQRFAFAEDLIVCCFAGDGLAAVALWSPKLGWHGQVDWPLDLENYDSEIDGSASFIGVHYDSVEEKTVAVLSCGDFVEVSDDEATVVGSLNEQLLACAWSPTGEMAAVITADDRLLLLSTDFSMGGDVVLSEHKLTVDDMKLAEKHVSVGWGKKETQFQGRGARAAADPTVNLDIESRDMVDGDRGEIELSWRGDGQFVVVNSAVGGQRALRVFSSDGRLDSASEPAASLRGLVAYEPKGALIATVRQSMLQFFERNGLKRYNFELPDAAEAQQLAWSSDSTVLSVVYPTRIDLWVQKNWHWYRKQSVSVSGMVEWHSERPRTMGVLLPSGEIRFYTWEFRVASEEGLTAVIDRNEVKVTPLARAGVPPPMAFANVEFDVQPVAVAVRAPNRVAVALPTEVKILELNMDTAQLKEVNTIPVSASALAFGEQLVMETANGIVDESQAVVARPNAVVNVLRGSHYLVGPYLFDISDRQVVDFGEPCVDFVAGDATSFGLTRSGKLVSGQGQTIAHGVTSILGTSTHLLFTTLTTLGFVHLSTTTNHSEVSGIEQRREIERGSLLVSVMTQQMAVVLQAPRGNIETIYPRILVLGVVRELVAQQRYYDAFTATKVHRIDMNLLYDLNPKQFEAGVEQFVAELKTPANLDLFMGALSDEDTTVLKYKDTSKPTEVIDRDTMKPETSEQTISEGKANRVLALLKPLLPPQSSLTSLALRKPPALVEALAEAAHSPELIKHLVFLTEADDLYRTALGGYEPRLALAVAQQAQMDPKEYLPFLRGLMIQKSVERSKFDIDVFLKRYDRAITHLIAVKGDDDALETEIGEFVEHHGLHDEALALLRGSGRKSEQLVLASRAQIYLSKSQYEQAGLDFEMLGEIDKAIKAYAQGSVWRRALSLTKPEQMSSVAEELVEIMETNKQYADSAHLALHYLSDPKRALQFYCSANLFEDAILISHIHSGLKELLEDQLRESFGTFLELLADFKAQIPSQLKRLRQIREKRQQDTLGFERLSKEMDELDVADNLSLAGTDASTATGASAYTRYTDKSGAHTVGTNATRRTLKNQRRQERKKARGKKGSVYEEDYLVASTGRLVERLVVTKPDLLAMITALIRVKQFFYAEQLTKEYNTVVALLVNNIDEIYTLDDEMLIRFDDSGHEYTAEKPKAPSIPDTL